MSNKNTGTDSNRSDTTHNPQESDVELHRLLTFRTVEHTLGRLLDERFTGLLATGVRYPLTNRDPLRTVLFGGYLLLPFLIAIYAVFTTSAAGLLAAQLSIGDTILTLHAPAIIALSLLSAPVLGYLTYIVQWSVTGEATLRPFPPYTERAEWLKLTVVGCKVLLIVVICFLTPLTFASNTIGGVFGSSLSQLLNLTAANYLLLLGGVVLLSLYPAIIGAFVQHGRLSTGINAPKRPVLTSHEYLRGVSVLVVLLAVTGFTIQILFGLFGPASLVLVGPIVFYFLLSAHHIIGLSWNETTADPLEAYPSPELPVLTDQSSEVDPVAKAFETDAEWDCYEISTWEVRTRLDRVAVRLYEGIRKRPLLLVSLYFVLMAFVQLSRQGGFLIQPGSLLPFTISVLPAGLLTSYIVYRYATPNTPVRALAVTLLLGAVFAVCIFGITSLFSMGPGAGHAGSILYSLFILAPANELSKILAVWLYAYRCKYFNSVIDGVIYGVVAGFGFAFMLNMTWLLGPLVQPELTTFRTVYSPLVVLLSGVSGYYLGLAKFNSEATGPILLKGLVIVVLISSLFEFFTIVLDEVSSTNLELWATPLAGTQFVSYYILVYTAITTLFIFALTVILLRKLSTYARLYTQIDCPDPTVTEDEATGADIRYRERTEQLRKLHDAGLLTDEEFYTLSTNS